MSELLDPLIAVSARVGGDLDLVQAGGGNTSVKDGQTLWVKASGKWLAHAAHDDMFLPVPMADIAQKLAAADETFPEYRSRSGVSLRPSVETSVHAVLPHKVVIHVHSVRTISFAAQQHGQAEVAPRLAGLRWAWIPYTHPGVPLALRIRDEKPFPPEVLILENHGLVVAADNCDAAEHLLRDVEKRLDTQPRTADSPDLQRLETLVAASDWHLPEDHEVHALGTSLPSCQVAAGGTLFPDQCVYLGPAAAVVQENESLQTAATRYRQKFQFEPVFLIVPGAGVVVRQGMKRAARELLICLKRAIERMPDPQKVIYLPVDQVARLMNWDAEKYRIAMAQLTNV